MAKTKAKALTRKITRKRAMSYDRMAPNKRGVTALSEVNGRGAYAKRYARTRRSLEEDSMPKRRRKRRKTSASAKRASFKPNLKQGGKKSGRKTKRLSKKEFIAKQRRKGRSPAQAAADYKLATGYYEKAKARKKRGRRYGKGKYKALKARVGRGPKRRERYTYFYRTPKGGVRKIPDHALLGYRSAREMLEVQRTGTEAERGRLSKRMQALLDRRIRAGKRAEQRAIEGRAWFSPNPGEVLTFEEWNTMKRNARKSTKKKSSRKKKTSRRPATKAAYIRSQMAKGRTRAQAEGDWSRSQKMKRKARSGGKKKTTRRKARKVTTRKRSTRRKASSRKKSTRRKATTRKRKRTTSRKRKATTRKRKRTTRRKSSARRGVKRDSAGRRITAKRRAAAKRNLKKACRTVRKMKSNKRGSYALARRSSSKTTKRKSGKKRRSMKPNAVGAAYKMELRNSFKFGFIVLGGFLTHRIATNLFDRYALGKVSALGKGAIAPWRKSLSGLLVAAVGVPFTIRMLPKHAGVAAAGMGASLLYDVLITGLQVAKMDKAAEAISAYPDAPGYPQYSGMGSYYEFSPHQVYGGSGYGGFGEYYETQYTPGLEQAAAGMGGAEPLMQAAAGVQQMAANQMGEYYAYGVEGIGEYESAPSAPSSAGYLDDGIMPNTHSAEQMLDVAEAMAGGVGNYDVLTQAAAGFGDLPLEQTVQPTIRAMDIPDSPGGSRAGILQGGDGIFG